MPKWLFVRDQGEDSQVPLRDIAGQAKAVGVLADSVSFQTRSGAELKLPCGGHAETMVSLLNALGDQPAGDSRLEMSHLMLARRASPA